MKPRVAIIHDYLVVRGGAERVAVSLSRLYPDAPIYTAIYRPETTLPEFRDLDVRPLWPSRLPLDNRTYRPFILAYALAFQRLRLAGYDVALSESGGFAKAAGIDAGKRVSLCLTTPRFIWPAGEGSRPPGGLERTGQALMRPLLRRLDLQAAARVDAFAAISANSKDRVRRDYGRDAVVIHPPLELDRFTLGDQPATARSGFLTVGRLVHYKRFDRVIEAVKGSGQSLKLAGSGPDEARLRALAGPEVSFLGHVSDSELAGLYRTARALIVPGEEDWGLTPLEANAAGCPVIAAARGGALETVVDGVTGILFDPDREGALADAFERFKGLEVSPERLRRYAESFNERRFHAEIEELVAQALEPA